jgi:hypothetical protein
VRLSIAWQPARFGTIKGVIKAVTFPARDVNLDEWLDGIGFKPANTERKQLGHEAARQVIAEMGRTLHGMLPPGRDKSLVFTHLEDVLMRSNRALAIGDGPDEWIDTDTLRRLAAHGPLEADPRVEAYKAEQRGEEWPGPRGAEHIGEPAEPVETYRESVTVGSDSMALQVAGQVMRGPSGYVDIAVICTNPENVAEAVKAPGFDGFHRVLDTSEQVQHAVNAILHAADHAGIGHGITVSIA